MARARKPTASNDDDITKRIDELAAKGGTALSIAAALKVDGVQGWGSTIVGRYLRSKLGTRRARKASPAPPPSSPSGAAPLAELPEKPSDIEGADIAKLEWWIKIAEGMAADAQRTGNVAMLARAATVVKQIYEEKRKWQQGDEDDEEDDRDYAAIAKRVREKLHSYIGEAVQGAKR